MEVLGREAFNLLVADAERGALGPKQGTPNTQCSRPNVQGGDPREMISRNAGRGTRKAERDNWNTQYPMLKTQCPRLRRKKVPRAGQGCRPTKRFIR